MKFGIWRYWLVILVVQAGLALTLSLLWASWNATLETHAQWRVSKRHLAMGVMGAQQFYTDRQALASGALNLGSWHGFQEVITTTEFDLARLEAVFDLDNRAYVYVLVGCHEDSCYALRISTHPDYRNAWVQLKPSGEFISVEMLPVVDVMNQNNTVTFWFNRNRDSLGIVVNDQFLREVSIPQFAGGAIGFRGGLQGTFIREVSVWDTVGERVFHDSFAISEAGKMVVMRIWSWLLFGDLCVLALFIFREKTPFLEKKLVSKQIVLWSCALLVTAVATIPFMQYFASRYPSVQGWFGSLLTAERHYLDVESQLRTEAIITEMQGLSSEVQKILVIGSSQTWGAGALFVDETFVSRLNALKARTPREATQLQFVGAGINGLSAADLLRLYENHWRSQKPAVLVLNLSSNDADGAIFEAALRRFVWLCREDNVQLVFVLEPNAPEFRRVINNHEVMRAISQEFKIPVIDAHTHMATQLQQGIIWWDFVHLTSFGQQVLAEYLFQELQPILASRP